MVAHRCCSDIHLGCVQLVDKAFIAVCRSLYESGLVLPDEAHWLVELMHARDPRVLAARDVFATGRDEEELKDTLTRIAKLASNDPQFLLRYGVDDDKDGLDAALAAGSVGARFTVPSLPNAPSRALAELLERVFAAPCDDVSDEFGSDAAAALVALAR